MHIIMHIHIWQEPAVCTNMNPTWKTYICQNTSWCTCGMHIIHVCIKRTFVGNSRGNWLTPFWNACGGTPALIALNNCWIRTFNFLFHNPSLLSLVTTVMILPVHQFPPHQFPPPSHHHFFFTSTKSSRRDFTPVLRRQPETIGHWNPSNQGGALNQDHPKLMLLSR